VPQLTCLLKIYDNSEIFEEDSTKVLIDSLDSLFLIHLTVKRADTPIVGFKYEFYPMRGIGFLSKTGLP